MLAENSLSLRVGDEISPEILAERLVRMGFTPVSLVESVGQFAHRGGIFDFYAAGEPYPVRLEFFGDEIDRLAYFDPISQRVSTSVPSISLSPARESLWDGESRRAMATAHKALLKEATGETRTTLTAELALLEGEGGEGRTEYLVTEGAEAFGRIAARMTGHSLGDAIREITLPI